MQWQLNTSNQGKLQEFQRLFAEHGAAVTALNRDLKKIEAKTLKVIACKASQMRERVLFEVCS